MQKCREHNKKHEPILYHKVRIGLIDLCVAAIIENKILVTSTEMKNLKQKSTVQGYTNSLYLCNSLKQCTLHFFQ